ncbi:MAG: hypothetical protein JNL79_00290 [Myxococcales bacterium]|nr:hypothetical protein [Myxococcales bacterium]
MSPVLTWLLVGFAAALLIFGFWVDGRTEGRFARFGKLGWVLQIAAALLAYGVLRPGRGDSSQLSSQLAAGQPVFLDFYSNY